MAKFFNAVINVDDTTEMESYNYRGNRRIPFYTLSQVRIKKLASQKNHWLRLPQSRLGKTQLLLRLTLKLTQ